MRSSRTCFCAASASVGLVLGDGGDHYGSGLFSRDFSVAPTRESVGVKWAGKERVFERPETLFIFSRPRRARVVAGSRPRAAVGIMMGFDHRGSRIHAMVW